jgi:hypothetical protein
MSDKPTVQQSSDRLHIDNWLYYRLRTSESSEAYAAFVIDNFRKSATWQNSVRPWMSQFKLFATYKGTRYRITGASRLGDVYCQPDFEKDHAYEHRVDVLTLTDWSDKP